MLEVSIDYLRERINEPGNTFTLTLINCERFAYRDYESNSFVTDLSTISEIGPGILSSEMQQEVCIVHGDRGLLEIVASDGSISINGRPFLLTELFQTAKEYWEEWERKNKSKRKKPGR